MNDGGVKYSCGKHPGETKGHDWSVEEGALSLGITSQPGGREYRQKDMCIELFTQGKLPILHLKENIRLYFLCRVFGVCLRHRKLNALVKNIDSEISDFSQILEFLKKICGSNDMFCNRC